jgi:hypothetical protein
MKMYGGVEVHEDIRSKIMDLLHQDHSRSAGQSNYRER